MVKSWTCMGLPYNSINICHQLQAEISFTNSIWSAYFEDGTHEFWWTIIVKSECGSIFQPRSKKNRSILELSFNSKLKWAKIEEESRRDRICVSPYGLKIALKANDHKSSNKKLVFKLIALCKCATFAVRFQKAKEPQRY